MSNDASPPEVIYFSMTGGKSAPFYRTLGGIRSAFKTTWWAQNGWNRPGGRPKVYAGTITWREVDLETGLPLLPYYGGGADLMDHLRVWHPDLITGHNPAGVHDLVGATDHVHGEVQ